ncbi:sugar phosphate isomerase/epimerase [candidate division KSB1 bacterium]|nr:sugar phosphate isomerase/epimerase [candidate division KSB1 bacterium]
MARPVTLFTGQWADLTLADLAKKAKKWNYDGLELACWGDHFEVSKAARDAAYCSERQELLAKHGLKVWAISNHLAGQLVCDPNDFRTDDFAPEKYRGKPEEKRKWAIEEMIRTGVAAKKLGVKIVNGFTGSSIWHLLYSFPPFDFKVIDEGFEFFAEKWAPILDEYQKLDIKFGLEVHPTEIAFDIMTTRRALQAINNHPAFGFNFDPSHLQWQGVEPVRFIQQFSDRIFHVHMKDAIVSLDGETSILASHLNFGDPRRGWDFRSLGRGDVDFEAIIRALNVIGYDGPLSVEWEDSGMDREHGASEACRFVKDIDFEPSKVAFDAAFKDE